MTASRKHNLVGHFGGNKFQPNAAVFATEISKAIDALPPIVDIYMSVWSIHVAHKGDIMQMDRSFEVIIDLDREDVLVSLSLTRGSLSLCRIWRGSIEESVSVVGAYAMEMLELRASRRAELCLSISNVANLPGTTPGSRR